MERVTSISLGDHFDAFVDKEVSIGRFKTACEVIRAGVGLLEEEECKVITLKMAIEDGIESGMTTAFNADDHLKRLKSTKRSNG